MVTLLDACQKQKVAMQVQLAEAETIFNIHKWLQNVYKFIMTYPSIAIIESP